MAKHRGRRLLAAADALVNRLYGSRLNPLYQSGTIAVVLLLVLGLLGFLMRRYGLPVLPLIIGAIIGPLAERQLRQALQLSAGSPTGLFNEGIAVGTYVIIAIILVWPFLAKAVGRVRGPRAGTAADHTTNDHDHTTPTPTERT